MPGKAGCSGRPKSSTLLQPLDTNVAPKNVGRPAKRKLEEEVIKNKTDALRTGANSDENKENEPAVENIKRKKPKVRTLSQVELLKDEVLGKPIERIPTSKLPTKSLIYRKWRALHKDGHLQNAKITNSGIAECITKEVLFIWQTASIPHIREDKVKSKVLKMIEEFIGLMRHAQRLSTEKDPLRSFVQNIENIFDIAPTDIEEQMAGTNRFTWKEDLGFYRNQCLVPQVGSITGVDNVYKAMTKRKMEKSERKMAQEERETARKASIEASKIPQLE